MSVAIFFLLLNGCTLTQSLFSKESDNSVKDSFIYVALGDSILIDKWAGGEDCNCGASSLLLENLNDKFPYYFGKDLLTLFADAKLISLAKDAALFEGFLDDQIDEFKSKKIIPDLVTISIGGNDLVQFLKTKLHESNKPELNIFIANFEQNLLELEKFITYLNSQNEDIIIFLLNIYDPTDGLGFDFTRNEFLSRSNNLKMYFLLNQLNTKLAVFSAKNNLQLIDIHSHFLGHGLSAVKYKDINPFYDPGNDTFWYHPQVIIDVNGLGAHEIRKLLYDALNTQLDKMD
ncbi:MAG: SGNH/GDSL hydrolase family protein [Proteobacteria bacterium]|nr:SGNH/GDSL hydrolase family protein [Pseudomonadota bacterium]MBU1710108.1 SGNH/GDSL hydrolase family protein [Pseudomonadota bacterium]